jgi:ribosomal protein L11 methylase PrmA
MLPDISKFMHSETVLVISGIIDERCDDVNKSINENGFIKVEEIHENGWCAISLKLQ